MNLSAVRVQIADGLPVTSRQQSAVQILDPFAQIIANMAAQMQEQETGDAGISPPKRDKSFAGLDAMLMAAQQMLTNQAAMPQEQGTEPILQEVDLTAAGVAPQEVIMQQGQINMPQQGSVQIPQQASAQIPQQVSVQAPQQISAQMPEQAGAQVLAQAVLPKSDAGKPVEFRPTDITGLPLKESGIEGEVQNTEAPKVTNSDGDEDQLYTVQRQFRNTVDVVKSRLQKQQDTPKTEEMNVDQLQSQVNAQKSMTGITLKKAETVSTEPKLLEQLTSGIAEKLQNGVNDNEFILKLKPANLGEITVKLVEKAGKTTLSIVTASPQTAKLINNDLSALREALRPMEVEVKEAVQHTQESNHSQMNFDMSGGQRFTDGRQAFPGKQHQPVYYAGGEVEEAEEPVSEQPQAIEHYIMI